MGIGDGVVGFFNTIILNIEQRNFMDEKNEVDRPYYSCFP